jgi:hypothetical protein
VLTWAGATHASKQEIKKIIKKIQSGQSRTQTRPRRRRDIRGGPYSVSTHPRAQIPIVIATAVVVVVMPAAGLVIIAVVVSMMAAAPAEVITVPNALVAALVFLGLFTLIPNPLVIGEEFQQILHLLAYCKLSVQLNE